MKVSFSPPDMTEQEAKEVREAILSGWITTDPRTKKLEQQISEFVHTAERGIATNVHYKPLPLMTAYKALGFDIKNYPNAYHLFENEVTLPLHTCLTDEEVN